MNGRHLCFAALACVFTIGCGSSAPVDIPGGDSGGENLLKLNNLIIDASNKLSRPPRSEAEFRGKVDKTQFEVVCKSPNDGQPYVIIWGVDPANPKGRNGAASVVVAYEKTGQNGFRWVLTSTGVDKLDAEQFKNANFPVGHQPPA